MNKMIDPKEILIAQLSEQAKHIRRSKIENIVKISIGLLMGAIVAYGFFSGHDDHKIIYIFVWIYCMYSVLENQFKCTNSNLDLAEIRSDIAFLKDPDSKVSSVEVCSDSVKVEVKNVDDPNK